MTKEQMATTMTVPFRVPASAAAAESTRATFIALAELFEVVGNQEKADLWRFRATLMEKL